MPLNLGARTPALSPAKKREPLLVYVLICLMSSSLSALQLAQWWMTGSQWRTLNDVATEGTITESRVAESKWKNNAPRYDFQVRYAYEVRGRAYTGEQVIQGKIRSGLELAQELSVRFPVNARVPVYHPEGEPSRAVLLRAPEGAISPAHLMGFFALLTAAVCSGHAVFVEARQLSRGVHARVREGRTHVRLHSGGMCWIVLIVLLAGVAALLPTTMILYVSWVKLSFLLGGVLVASGLAGLVYASLLRSTLGDLILDGKQGTLVPPYTFVEQSTERLAVPLSHIRRLRVEETRNKQRGYKWSILLSREGRSDELKIMETYFEARAEALFSWLAQRPELEHVLFVPR